MATQGYWLGSGNDGNFAALFTAAQTAANRVDGWIVGKSAVATSSEFDAGTNQLASTFTSNTTTPKPASFLTGTTANAIKFPAALTGTFAATAWSFTFSVRATVVGLQTGRVRFRVFKSVNASGASAVELTSSPMVCATTTTLSASADATSASFAWSPGAVTLSNEFLFVAFAWEIVAAGGSNSNDVVIRTGSTPFAGTYFQTPDFAPAVTATKKPAVVSSRVPVIRAATR